MRLALLALAAWLLLAGSAAASERLGATLLVAPTEAVHYSVQCGSELFSRVLVLRPHGKSVGPMHVRRSGDLIWRAPRGIVKFGNSHTIINRTNRPILFVGFCEEETP